MYFNLKTKFDFKKTYFIHFSSFSRSNKDKGNKKNVQNVKLNEYSFSLKIFQSFNKHAVTVKLLFTQKMAKYTDKTNTVRESNENTKKVHTYIQ